jgi:protease-4
LAAIQESDGYILSGQTAVIPLSGPLMKGRSKFGGTSTVEVRRALRQALRSQEVANILLHIDSPGGHVAGIQELADEVVRINAQKPVLAHIDDMGASGAYWVASQAAEISAGRTTEVGSIGTIAVVEDSSERMDRLGIRVHVLATGAYKGLGVAGARISEKALGYLQERVERLNEHFLEAVSRGREMSRDEVLRVADGRTWLAREAQAAGLIDRVGTLDEALARLASSVGATTTPRRAAAQERLAALRERTYGKAKN